MPLKLQIPENDLETINIVKQVTPEASLLAAILERALRDAAGYGPRKEQDSAYSWVFSFYESPPEWSFEWICSFLDFSTSQLRGVVKGSLLKGVPLMKEGTFVRQLRKAFR